MNKETEQKINESMRKVKPFSHIVKVAISIIDNGTTDTHKLADVISKDPILSARILSLANSPFYGMNRTINDIENACVILGNNVIKNILISAGALESFPVTEQRKSIWAHSMEVAAVSEFLAKKFNQSQSAAYITGLLHDVGKFVLIDSFPELQSVIKSGYSMECDKSIEEETKNIGINHAEAGARIIKLWNLPETVQNTVAMHHKPSDAVDNATCTLLTLADEICHKVEMNLAEEEILRCLKNEILAPLNITRQHVEEILPEIKQKIVSMGNFAEQL